MSRTFTPWRGSPEATLSVRRLTSFAERFRGLIGRPELAPGEAVWLTPCRQVHTFFMRFPIDVIHLDGDGMILGVETLAPFRVGRYHHRAVSVLELRGGEASRLGFQPGGRPSLRGSEPGARDL